MDPITNFVSPQFHTVHDDNFTSVLRKRVDILPPDWNKLFNYNDKIPDDILVNTPLTATMSNEGDKVVKVKVRFDGGTVIRPNENEESSSDITESDSTDNLISVDLNDDSNIFENEYDEGESSSSNYTPEPESIKTTRTGRKIHAPSKYSNYTMLLLVF